MKTVIALTKYAAKGASSRVRFANLYPHLEQLGWRVCWYPLLPDKVLNEFYERGKYPVSTIAKAYLRRVRLLATVRKPDVWWIEKEILYGVPDLMETFLVEEILERAVIDYDDGVFLNYKTEKFHPLGRLNKFTRYARSAAVITYGS